MGGLLRRRVEQIPGRPPGGKIEAEMQIRVAGRYPAARRAHDVALLDQIGLQYFLDSAAVLADSGRQVVEADRSAVEFFDDGQQQAAILVVEAVHVDDQDRRLLIDRKRTRL